LSFYGDPILSHDIHNLAVQVMDYYHADAQYHVTFVYLLCNL